MFLHCKKCIQEIPAGISPANYSAIEVGVGMKGLIVWCRRHDIEIQTFEIETETDQFVCNECGEPEPTVN